MDQAQQLRNMVKIQTPPRHTARVITVTSGKGGVGKSSVSVNLAIALSKLGQRVVILDADFGLANVEIMLGIRPKYSLADLMFKGKGLRDIVTDGPEDIGFISGGSGIKELSNLSKEQILNLSARLIELDELADVIIIDTGAGISDSVMEFVMSSSEILLVATPEPTSITDSYALLKTMNQKPEFVAEHTAIKLIANRVRSEDEGLELYQKLNTVVERFLDISLQYMGSIPQDTHISQAVMMQRPFYLQYPTAAASQAVEEMAEKLVGMEAKSEDGRNIRKGIAGLFSAVIKRKK